jgi:hypothetical protein
MYTEMWTYRDDLMDATGLEGFDVEALDGSIGKIDEATTDVGRSYVVVDTGPWIFGRKVVIPAGTIARIDRDAQKVHVDMTKDQIKDSPEYDKDLGWDDEEYRTRLGTYYGDLRRAS